MKMIKRIILGIVLVLLTGSSLFAQKNLQTANSKEGIYVPEMTKEQKADQINKNRAKLAEIKKAETLTVEKNAITNQENLVNPSTINENKMNSATIENTQTNVQVMQVAKKVLDPNKIEEKDRNINVNEKIEKK